MKKFFWLALFLIGLTGVLWWMLFAPVSSELQQHRWLLSSIVGADGRPILVWDDPKSFYLEFLPEGRVGGKAYCNAIDGKVYTIRFSRKLWIPEFWLFTTLMNCMPIQNSDMGSLDMEKLFTKSLASATRYHLEGDELHIHFDRSRQELIFRPAPAGGQE